MKNKWKDRECSRGSTNIKNLSLKDRGKRILAFALSFLMMNSVIDFPEPLIVNAACDPEAYTVMEFEGLGETQEFQELPFGAKESDILFPDTLNAIVEYTAFDESEEEIKEAEGASVTDASAESSARTETKNLTIEGITWKLDREQSDFDAFTSDAVELAQYGGAYFVYTAVIPEKNADGNIYTLAEKVELPEIYVMVGNTNVDIALLNESNVMDVSTLETRNISFGAGYSDYIVIDADNVSDFEGKTLTGTTTNGIFISNFVTVNLTIENLNITKSQDISSCISVGYGATLNLTIKGDNTLNATGWGGAGIEVMGQTKATLRITSDSTGTLTANGGYGSSLYGSWGGAGIGGMARITSDIKQVYVGNIIIEGGTINATGGYMAAGIGGTVGESGGNITITGGTVNATGGYGAAGIGGGSNGCVDSITISSGTVTATSGNDHAAAIGNGFEGAKNANNVLNFGNISITGGMVTANGNIGYGSLFNESFISNGEGTVTISDDASLTLNGEIKLGGNDTTSSNKYTLYFAIYDGRFTADTTVKIMCGGKAVAEEVTATLSHNGKIEGTATFFSSSSLAGEQSFTFATDNRTYTGAVTISGGTSEINIEIGTPLYPVTLEFYGDEITSDVEIASIIVKQGGNELSAENGAYYAPGDITYQRYGYGTMLCYLPANSDADTTEISVATSSLNNGNAITKSDLTISADGDNTFTLLETDALLLSVTAKMYGTSAVIRMETNKKIDDLFYRYKQSDTELTDLDAVISGSKYNVSGDGYVEFTISNLELNQSYDYYFVAAKFSGKPCSNIVHLTFTTAAAAELKKADGTSEIYETFDAACAAAGSEENCTVKLIGDALTDGNVALDGRFTIDLNGKELTSKKYYGSVSSYLIVNGNITITDSIGGGKIIGEGGSSYGCLIKGNSGSKLTILGGCFENTLNTNNNSFGIALRWTESADLDIQGGTFISDYTHAVSIYGLTSDEYNSSNIALSGGQFYSGFRESSSGITSSQLLAPGYAYKYLSGENKGKLTTCNVGKTDVAVVPANLKGQLTVTGDTNIGSTLTAAFTPDTSEWVSSTDIGNYTYTWYRVGENEDVQLQTSSEATNNMSDTYTIKADDLRSQIYCAVTAEKCGGSVQSDAVIVPGALISGAEIILSAESLPYNGEAQTPAVTVKLGEVTLTENTDYTLFYANNKNIGTAIVSVVGKGRYEGSASKTFTITKGVVTVSGITAQEKIYDGTTGAVLDFDNVIFSGKAEGDTLTVTAAGTFADANAGENKTVTITGMTLGGTSAGNYVLADSGNQTEVSASIKPRPVTLKWSENTALTYNGNEQSVTAIVSNGIGSDSFTLTYENSGANTNTATEVGSYTAKVTSLGNENYTLESATNISEDWSISYLEARAAVPSGSSGVGWWWTSAVTLMPYSGYQISRDKNTWSDYLTYSEDGEHEVAYYLKQTSTGYITNKMTKTSRGRSVIQIDSTAPTGEIQIKENRFKSFLDTITFDHFFKNSVDITVTAEDTTSGVYSIEYIKATETMTRDEVRALGHDAWTTVVKNKENGSFSVPTNEKCIVYIRITDNVGNRTYLSSDGIVIYTDVVDTANVAFAKTSIEDVDAGISLNGNTVAAIVNGTGSTLDASAYEVANDRLLLKATYLDTLEVGTYTLTVSYNPLGETYTSGVSVGDAPQTTEITLTVKKAGLTVSTAPTLRGIYGTKVEEMTIDAANAKVVDVTGAEINGTWSVTDANQSNIPGVGTSTEYELTFTPGSDVADIYDNVTTKVVPIVSKRTISVTIADATRRYREADPSFTYDLTEGNSLVGNDTLDMLGVNLFTKAGESADVGEYAITGTSASVNYDVIFTDGTLIITKADASGEISENKSYTYTVGSNGSNVTIDVAGKLPNDKGTANYSVSISDTDGILEDVPTVDADGSLSYQVKRNTTAGQTATITVTATMQNYEDTTYSLTITIVDKKLVSEKSGSEVGISGSNALIYGQRLSELTLNTSTAVFVEQDTDTVVAGTLAWKNPEKVPNAGITTVTWVFTPTNSEEYTELEGTVTISVAKAVPTLTAPTVTSAVYSRTATLERDFTLTGGSAKHTIYGEDTDVAGEFSWQNGAVTPTVDNRGYVVLFTPTDSTNYESATVTVNVTVNKAENAPNMPSEVMSVANSITKVGDVSLSDYADWVWKDSDVEKALVAGESVTAVAIYTGSDKDNYVKTSVTVSITRGSCDHINTEVRNASMATCTADGYTGDTYCTDCDVTIKTGTTTPALGHHYVSRVTMQSTTESEGVMTYTCDRCGHSYTKPIAKLQDTEDNEVGEDLQTEDNNQDTGKPYIRDDSGKEGWDVIKDEAEKAKDGETIVVEMNGSIVQTAGEAVGETVEESVDKTEDITTGAEVTSDAWNPWWIIVIGMVVIIIGFGVFLLLRKKKEE